MRTGVAGVEATFLIRLTRGQAIDRGLLGGEGFGRGGGFNTDAHGGVGDDFRLLK